MGSYVNQATPRHVLSLHLLKYFTTFLKKFYVMGVLFTHLCIRYMQCPWRSEEGVRYLEQELRMVLSCHMVLGTKPASSMRIRALKH